MRPQLKIVLLLVVITLGLLYLSSFTGFFTASGLNWEGAQQVTATASQQQVVQHIVFGNYKTANCADGIFVETQNGVSVNFRTAGEVYNSNNLCAETDVIFDNIIYKQQPSLGISGMQQSITYNIYYGKISATAGQPALEIKQPSFRTSSDVGVCSIISSSGLWTLTANLTGEYGVGSIPDKYSVTGGTGFCINITSSNVILDCAGYTIIGSGTGTNHGISVGGRTNVTIKNCGNISKYSTGIYFNTVTYSVITNNSLYFNPPPAGGGDTSAIHMQNSNYNNITDNTANNNDYGIFLTTSSHDNNLVNNIVSNNTDTGIFLTATCYRNTITNNTANTNTNSGIQVGSGSLDNTITNNTANSNSGYGIYLNSSGTNNTLANNTANNNGAGIYLLSAGSGNNIINNTVNSNNNGISLQTSTGATTIINNTANSNSNNGIYLGSSSNSNTLTNNTANSNSYGLYLQSSSNTLTNNTANSNTQYGITISGSSYNNLTSNRLSNNVNRGVSITGASNNNTAYNNTLNNNNANIYILANNAQYNNISTNTITSGTNGVQLYFEGSGTNNSIEYNTISSQTDKGILVNFADLGPLSINEYIRHNRISSCGYGIYVQNIKDNTFLNNSITASNNYDIYLKNAQNNTFINHTLTGGGVSSLEYPTTINFVAWAPTSYDIVLKGVETPHADPNGYANVSKYVAAATIGVLGFGGSGGGGAAWLYLNISYNDSDLGSAIESTLNMSKYSGAWDTITRDFSSGPYGRNTAANYVYANITNFGSDFAPLGISSTITNCTNFTEAAHYDLTTDITNSDALTCMDVQADNVVLDCQGHTIDGTDTENTIGVKVYNRTNVTIENCAISDWGGSALTGVSFSNTNSSLIRNNTISSNWDEGVRLTTSSNNNITNNTLTGNGIGIKIETSSNYNIIANNTANTNTYGITLSSSSNNNITSNTARLNTQHGIYLSSSSGSNNITNNNASSNTQYGIAIFSSTLNSLNNNTVNSNAIGIVFSGNSNTLTNNTANSNTNQGFNVGSSHNVFTNNNASSNTNYDVYLVGGQTNNTFTNQTFSSYPTKTSFTYAGTTIGLKGVTSPPSDPVVNTYANISKYVSAVIEGGTGFGGSGGGGGGVSWLYLNISYEDSDLHGMSEDSLNMTKNNGTWYTNPTIFTSSYGVNTVTNYVYANITNFGSTFAPLGKTYNITGNTTISEAGTYKLPSSVTNSPVSTYANITASDVTFDCQGYTIDGTHNEYTQGIRIAPSSGSISNITIKNCVITDWDKGIGIFAGATGIVIDNNTLSSNWGSGVSAIHIENTTGINVTNNNYSNNAGVPGIYLYNVNDSLIENNTANSNTYGIQLVSSNNNNVTNNTANSNTYYGFYLSSSSNNNRITNNTAYNNTFTGIYFYSNSNYNTLTNNTAYNSLRGIYLASSSSNTLLNNTAYNNADSGICLWSTSNYNNITNNNASSNTNYGIYIYSSSDSNTFTNNIANSNTQYGIYVKSSNNNAFTGGTTSSNTGYDIYIETSSAPGNTFTNQQIASYPTTMSFTAYAPDTLTFKGVTSPPATPEPFRNIGKYVDITKSGGGSDWVFLNISYSNSDLTAASVMNESTMRIAKYNATSPNWYTSPASFASSYGVNLGANYVYANITSFGSDFAPLGIPPQDFGQVNVTVETLLSITLVDNLVDFGTGFVTAGYPYADIDSNDTTSGTAGNWTNTSNGIHGWPGSKDFIVLENNGNVKANINISAGSTAASFIGGTSPDQWYAAEDNETISCDGTMQDTYTTLGTTQTSLCTSLRYNDTTDAINVLFKLRVPSDAAPAAKTNTITFSAVEA